MRPRSCWCVATGLWQLVKAVSLIHALTVQHKTIESVLERGEKLNDLVDRSNALSAQSKMFYKTAKKVRCCPVYSRFRY